MNRGEVRKRMQETLKEFGWTNNNQHPQTDEEAIQVANNNDGSKGWINVQHVHRKLLSSVADNPFFSVSEHAESIGNVSPWVMNRTTEELIRLGFLEKPLTYSLGKRGNPRKFLRITSKGAKHIGRDYEKCRVPGKGSYEHALCQHVVHSYLTKRGRSALVEHTLNGKAIDLCEFREDKTIWGYEIELRPIGHVIDNISRDLNAGCSCVIVIARNRTEQKRIMSLVYGKLPSGLLDKVDFKTIGEFYQ